MTRWLASLLAILLFAQEAWAADAGGHDHFNQGGLIAPNNAAYLVQALSDDLDHERRLVSGTGFIVLTDGGPNGDLSIGLGTALPVANGGTAATTASGALINLIGAPTKGKLLVGDGSVWNVLAVGTDGYVLTASSAAATGLTWSTTSLGSASEPYVVMSLSGALSAERALTAGTGLSLTDGGANGNATFSIDSTVATLTGSQTLTNKILTSPKIGTSLIFDGTGSNDVTITFTDPAAARAHNIPDVADATFILSEGDLTVNGTKTFSDLKLSGTTFKTSANTITVPAATDTLVNLGSAQTLTAKSLTSATLNTSLILDQSTADYTVTWNNPSGARAIKIEDVGGAAAVVLKGDGDAYTNGGVAYGNGSLLKISSGGSEGYVLTLRSNVPTWEQGASGMKGVCGGYVSLESGVAGSTTDQTNKSTVYLVVDPMSQCPGQIDIWNGSASVRYSFTEKSLDITGLTADKNYDVLAYISGGNVTLTTSSAWTNDTTRATSMVACSDGYLVSNSDNTQRYIATIRTYSPSSNCRARDDAEHRYVWNMYNAKPRSLVRIDTTDNWTYTSNTLHQANASSSNQVAIVCGAVGRTLSLTATSAGSNGSANDYIGTGIGIDSTSTNSAQVIAWAFAPTGGAYSFARANLVTAQTVGYHYYAWLENTYRTTGTTTFLGDNNNAEIAKGQTGIIGETWQ